MKTIIFLSFFCKKQGSELWGWQEPHMTLDLYFTKTVLKSQVNWNKEFETLPGKHQEHNLSHSSEWILPGHNLLKK